MLGMLEKQLRSGGCLWANHGVLSTSCVLELREKFKFSRRHLLVKTGGILAVCHPTSGDNYTWQPFLEYGSVCCPYIQPIVWQTSLSGAARQVFFLVLAVDCRCCCWFFVNTV